jgi:hypothetical protein
MEGFMEKMIILFTVSIFVLTACASIKEKPETFTYAVTKYPTPVLYTPDFASVFGGEDGVSLKFDDYGEIDELEFIALPGTLFHIEETIHTREYPVFKVTSRDYQYPTEKGYYIDSRFVVLTNKTQEGRVKVLPGYKQILRNLRNAEGAIYTWGGNYCRGIPELLHFYPPASEIPPVLQEQWMLCGVDCSGLLYEASNGCIPRNTSSLVYFGESVPVEGLPLPRITELLLPLDIIVWKGHMMVVIDNGEVIESSYDHDPETDGFQGGVRVFPVSKRLEKLLEERTPVNNYDTEMDSKKFVVRRWYNDQ